MTKCKKQVTDQYTEYNLIYLDELKGTCVWMCVWECLDKGLEGPVLNCELW